MAEPHPFTPQLEFALTISINLGKAYFVRPSNYGSERAAVYLLDGKVEGPYSELRGGKPAVTGQFVDDQKDGTWTIYAADGAVLRTATYKHGVLEGPYRELADGEVVEGAMASGRRSGAWTRTNRAGTVKTLTYTTP